MAEQDRTIDARLIAKTQLDCLGGNRHVEEADAAQAQLMRNVQTPNGSYSPGCLPAGA